MAALTIVGQTILAAVLYGIVHDQITARVCVEYFTIGHPPVFGTKDPTLLAFGWGVVATWWAGLLMGIPLAVAARLGPEPKRTPASLIRPIGILLLIMGVSALVSGMLGGWLGSRGDIRLYGSIARAVPAERHARFLADLWAHSASYFVGFAGGAVLAAMIWRDRSLARPVVLSPGWRQ